jgi:hypothetical protein
MAAQVKNDITDPSTARQFLSRLKLMKAKGKDGDVSPPSGGGEGGEEGSPGGGA